MIRRALVAIGIAACLVLISPWTIGAAESSEDSPPDSVCLIVDYGDGAQKHFTQLPWKKDMTVLDALLLARDHKHGIQLEYRGQTATALVTRIDDLANRGGSDRNWIYRVNKKPGTRSCGICPLEAGDTVLWKFETYR